MQKSLYVALAGAPNAGKSSLMNYIIGQKIAIVTPKVQTTRSIIRGLVTKDETQFIFIDTPGLFKPNAQHKLESSIVRSAWSGINEADYLLLLIDSTEKNPIDVEILKRLKNENISAVITKSDKSKLEKIEKIKQELEGLERFENIFIVSSRTGEGVNEMLEKLGQKAQPHPWPFPEGEVTDASVRFLSTEITRETLFFNLKEELPYSIAVETESWKEDEDGRTVIRQVIYVLKENHKIIIVGKGGSMIKKIGTDSRQKIKNLLGSEEVDLFLFVKVRPDWMNERDLLN